MMMRRARLAQVSKKRQQQLSDYEKAKTAVWYRDGGECRARTLWPDVECDGIRDPHHVWPQGVFPERRCDPEAMVVLCRAHHHHVHHVSPARARALGLLV